MQISELLYRAALIQNAAYFNAEVLRESRLRDANGHCPLIGNAEATVTAAARAVAVSAPVEHNRSDS